MISDSSYTTHTLNEWSGTWYARYSLPCNAFSFCLICTYGPTVCLLDIWPHFGENGSKRNRLISWDSLSTFRKTLCSNIEPFLSHIILKFPSDVCHAVSWESILPNMGPLLLFHVSSFWLIYFHGSDASLTPLHFERFPLNVYVAFNDMLFVCLFSCEGGRDRWYYIDGVYELHFLYCQEHPTSLAWHLPVHVQPPQKLLPPAIDRNAPHSQVSNTVFNINCDNAL